MVVKQDWMVIVAGDVLVDQLTAETRARVPHTGYGYESEALCALQREHSARGVLGAEVVQTLRGWSLRYDSGLQNWSIISARLPSLEQAEAAARGWVAAAPDRRYAWRRRG